MQYYSFRPFWLVIFFCLPNIAVSINCPICNNTLRCPGPGQVYCDHCHQDIFPDDLFSQYLESGATVDEGLLISQDGSRLNRANEHIILEGELCWFNPTQIISNQGLCHLLSYLKQRYRFGLNLRYAVFSSIALAQLLMLNVPELASLGEVEQQLALWWLTGYWLLYWSFVTRASAQEFLASAPDALHLNAAQHQIQSLQELTRNRLLLSDIMSLFWVRGHYVFSAAQSHLDRLGEGTPYLARMTLWDGMLIVIQRAGTYYIISPFNQLFTATSMDRALQIISQIAIAQFISKGFLLAVGETLLISGIGLGIGIVSGFPLFGVSCLAGSSLFTSLYAAWIAISIGVFNYRHNTCGAIPEIKNDLPGSEEQQDQAE